MTDSKRVMHLYDADPEEIGSFSTSRIILKPGEERLIRVGLGAHFDVNEPGEYVLYLTNPRFKLPIPAPSKKEIPIVRTKRTVTIICVPPEKQQK